MWIIAPYNQTEHEVVFSSSKKYIHLLYVQVSFVHLQSFARKVKMKLVQNLSK